MAVDGTTVKKSKSETEMKVMIDVECQVKPQLVATKLAYASMPSKWS